MGQNASQSRGQTTTTTEGSPTTLKPPDDPPESRLSREECYSMISEGRMFTRYCTTKTGKHCRSPVLVSYRKELKSICWGSRDTLSYDALHSMKIKDISHVVLGKHTPAFLTPVASTAPDSLCFSILSAKLHKSIDLEASDHVTAEEFARALEFLMGREISKVQPKISKARQWSLPAPPYQMPITQASLSQILNATLIQHSPGLIPKGTRRSSSKKGKTSAPTRKKIVGRKRKTTKSSPLLGGSTIISQPPSASSTVPPSFALTTDDLPHSD
eukprot:TRINITY_DN191_c0_g1_i4.p1 TRINITY_DN191_c0_g1~~TRINITY_DN191_c0_g1_i4.p1  ORF type:complete len:272 (+),score=7.64 TRINITY_DN191_c0_g1_i4:127-942(+)